MRAGSILRDAHTLSGFIISDHPLAIYVFSQDAEVKAKVFNETQSGGVVANETVIHPGGQRSPSYPPPPFLPLTPVLFIFCSRRSTVRRYRSQRMYVLI